MSVPVSGPGVGLAAGDGPSAGPGDGPRAAPGDGLAGGDGRAAGLGEAPAPGTTIETRVAIGPGDGDAGGSDAGGDDGAKTVTGAGVGVGTSGGAMQAQHTSSARHASRTVRGRAGARPRRRVCSMP